MPTVETTGGPIDVDELGLTLIHEHFRTTDEAGRFQFPHLYDEQAEWDAALADANAVKGHGVQTVVEPSAMFLTRDAAFSKRVADESGINVVLATGHLHLRPPPAVPRQPRRGRRRRDLRPRDRARHPGHRHQAGVHQVRRRRRGRHPQRREGPPRRRPRRQADRQADHGPLAPVQRHGPRADADLRRGGGRHRHRPHRPHRRHRRPRLHRAAARDRLLDRHGPLRARPLPADRAAQRDRDRPARAGYAERMFISQDYCSSIDWFPREVQDYLKANEVPDWSMTFLFESGHPHPQGTRDVRR